MTELTRGRAPSLSVRNKAKRAEYETYLFRILAIEPSYLLSSRETAISPSDTGEYLHPEIRAVCEFPAKLKGRETRMTFLASRTMLEEECRGHGLGALTMRGERSEYLGSIPMDIAISLPSTIAVGGYRWIHLHGETLKHGTARIKSVGFFHDVDPDDY